MSFNSLVLRIANLFSRPLLGRTRLYPRLRNQIQTGLINSFVVEPNRSCMGERFCYQHQVIIRALNVI